MAFRRRSRFASRSGSRPRLPPRVIAGDTTGPRLGSGVIALRTTCAGSSHHAWQSGVPTPLVRDSPGHAWLTMTSTYLRSRTDSLEDAYATLDQHHRRKGSTSSRLPPAVATRTIGARGACIDDNNFANERPASRKNSAGG